MNSDTLQYQDVYGRAMIQWSFSEGETIRFPYLSLSTEDIFLSATVMDYYIYDMITCHQAK